MILSEDSVLVQMECTTIFMNRPVYAGVSILDISKTIMYRFYYDFIKRYIQPSECVKIMYIDTDSFILEIKKHNPYEVLIKNHPNQFDTSNYAAENCWGIPRAKKEISGLFKDGNASQLMTHFIELQLQSDWLARCAKDQGSQETFVEN